MCDEFDSGMDMTDSFDTGVDSGSFDVDSIMDATPDVSDVEDFSDFEFEEETLDVDSIMDEAALDDTDFFEDDLIEDTELIEDASVEDALEDTEVLEEIPPEDVVEEEVIEETPIEELAEEPEIIEETPLEEITEEPEVLEETPVEEITEEPEVLEETPVEEITEEPEVLEETPVEEITEEPEVLEETPVEEITEEPEVLEETPVEEITEEPEVLEETPTEEITEEPEVLEEIPVEEITEEPEVLEEIPVEEITEEPEVLEETPAEEITEEPEVIEDIPVEGITEEPEVIEESPAEEIPEAPEMIEETPGAEVPEEIPAGGETSDFGPGPAQTAMGEYLAEHNYGREDYAEYSQDPQWQQLNNDLLVEMGQEPIDYSTQEIPAEIPAEIPTEADALPEIPLAEEMPAETGEVPERVYDEFEETVRLDQEDFYESGTFYTQGINEYGYEGTCGETSMANTINRVLGTNEYTENKVLDVAVQEGLCDTGSLDNSGGTTTDQFMELYEKMNETCGGQLDVQRHDFDNVLSMEEVAQRLDEGCTVNVAVDSATLWDQADPMGTPFPESRATDHWITVTDVHRDESGSITGFDIIDSGGGESYVDADKYEAMCYGTEDLELTDPTCIVVSKKDVELPAETMQTPEIPAEVPPQIPTETQEVAETITGLQPNDTYESNGYTYRTDADGRIVSASGELHLVDDHVRNPEAQLLAGGDDRAIRDDGGHLIATRFGGSGELDNLVAENAFVNRSQYKQLENAWARDLEAGNRVLVNIEPFYGTPGQRPTQIAGNYTVIRPDGSSYTEHFSMTNEDMRSPEFAVDFDMGPGDSFYNDLTPAQQLDYQASMETRGPKIDEGRVFRHDQTYEQFSACPEDSDEAFELQRVIHQPGRKR